MVKNLRHSFSKYILYKNGAIIKCIALGGYKNGMKPKNNLIFRTIKVSKFCRKYELKDAKQKFLTIAVNLNLTQLNSVKICYESQNNIKKWRESI